MVDAWSRDPRLVAVKEMVASHASPQAEVRARAASEPAMREALFQLHRLVSATVEMFGSNTLLLASALVILKRRAIDPTPLCVSANYTSWDDKQHAAEITDAVEKKIKECRESLGEADFSLLLRLLDYEFEGRTSLLEYDALWVRFDDAAALIQREEDVFEERRAWESRRDGWMPNRVLGLACRLSLVIAIGSLFLMALVQILRDLQLESTYTTPAVSRELVEAAAIGLAGFLFFGLVKGVAALRGRELFGTAPPRTVWPADEDLSRLQPKAVAKRFPRYARLHDVLETAKAAMVPYDRRHGVASRAEIAEAMKTAETDRDALFQRHGVTALPAWD